MITLRRNKLYNYNHWDEVIPGQLVLGAIPSRDHVKQLAKKVSDGGVGITGVVTLLQEHELVSSPFYKPATQNDWDLVEVEYKWVITEDYEPVKPVDLIAGADFIQEQVC